MWNKRPEETTPKSYNLHSAVGASAPVVSEPSEKKKEPTHVFSTSTVKPDTESCGGSATIGKAVRIVGQIYSKEDLFVDGDLEGTLEALEHKLTIGPNGKAHASVKAREVVVLGTIHGNVEAADRIEIRQDAKFVGDIRVARIVIEDGAYFKGSIDIVKPEPIKTTAESQGAILAVARNPEAATLGESSDSHIQSIN